jgi:RIO kinase 1
VAETDESRKMRQRLLRSDRENRYLRKDSDQRKSMEEVFDRSTLLAVEELVSRRTLSDLFGVMAAGKEARVYYGIDTKGKPVAVKIYLTSSSDFRKRMGYIAGDRRFGKLPSNSRDTIYVWVRKEFKNLQLADTAGVRVPKPIAFYKNILAMEYVGDPPNPAPTFAETEVDSSDYEWTFKMIGDLYRRGKLVHADLSEFNIFKRRDERILFDMGSAVLASHPHSEEFLRRDITNMVRFFRKRGIVSVDADSWLEETLS